MTPRRVLVGVLLLALLAGGVWALREATLTRHIPVAGADATRLVLHVRTQLDEMPAGTDVEQIAAAMVSTCLLEVRGEARSITRVERDRFFVVIDDPLGQSEETQVRGCLEDWALDHVLVDVVSVAPASRPS